MGTPEPHPGSIAVDDVRRLIRNARTASVNELANGGRPEITAAIVACLNNLDNNIDLLLMCATLPPEPAAAASVQTGAS